MVTVPELWLPIVVAAIAVFLVSSLIHMLLPYHRNDVQKLAVEDDVLAAIRRGPTEPGEYAVPHATMATMREAAFVEKRSAGPVALLTVTRGGLPTMGRELTLWFVYALVVSLFAAYVAGRAIGEGAVDYGEVFRFAATVAFAGYGLGIWQQTIWWGRPWATSAKSTFDALLYALVTGGVFGWLWPATTI